MPTISNLADPSFGWEDRKAVWDEIGKPPLGPYQDGKPNKPNNPNTAGNGHALLNP
jgi:hypothetical protein